MGISPRLPLHQCRCSPHRIHQRRRHQRQLTLPSRLYRPGMLRKQPPRLNQRHPTPHHHPPSQSCNHLSHRHWTPSPLHRNIRLKRPLPHNHSLQSGSNLYQHLFTACRSLPPEIGQSHCKIHQTIIPHYLRQLVTDQNNNFV